MRQLKIIEEEKPREMPTSKAETDRLALLGMAAEAGRVALKPNLAKQISYAAPGSETSPELLSIVNVSRKSTRGFDTTFKRQNI